MNIRNLIKLRKVELHEVKDRAYDNPFKHRLEVWHGPKEAPFHEGACFTDIELKKLLDNMVFLHNQIRESLHEENKSQPREISGNSEEVC